MKLIFQILLLLFTGVSGCKKNTGFEEVKFGEGGGFTGAVTEYKMSANGDVFIKDAESNTYKKIKTIAKDKIKEFGDAIHKIPNAAYIINKPGNIYYFLETSLGKITWGASDLTIPTEVQTAYDLLSSTVKSL